MKFKKEQKAPEEFKPRIDEEKIKKAEDFLKDPNLFEILAITEINKKVVGEELARKVIALCAHGGRLVENCQTASFNLLVNDDAGTGKDYVASATLSILPKQNYVKKTRISPTVLNYWHNSDEEPWWTWDGKVLYLEDISEMILNHDVFKVMCSSGSEATIVIDKKVVELEIKGKPVMIVTTATATPNPELTRRFVILNLDSSVNQTKEIMKRHSQFKKIGLTPEPNEFIKYSLQLLNRVKVKIPFAELIDQHFPANNVIMRTHYPRFLDFISASTALHQFQRQKDDEGFIIAQGADYNIARLCFLKLCSNKYMIPLTINQKKMLEIFEKEPKLTGTISHLHSEKMNFISDRALAYNLSLLTSYGLLETSAILNEQNKTVECYKLSENTNLNQKISIPTYEELCRFTSLPSTPSTPSLTSIPSLPNKKGDFVRGSEGNEGSEGYFGGINYAELTKEQKKILEEFE